MRSLMELLGETSQGNRKHAFPLASVTNPLARLREAIEEQNAPAWQTLRAFKKPFVFLAGEDEKVMGAEENLHFLTNSIPGAQGQPLQHECQKRLDF